MMAGTTGTKEKAAQQVAKASQKKALSSVCDRCHACLGPRASPVRSVLAPFVAMPFVTSSFLFLVAMPGAPSSVLAPSSF